MTLEEARKRITRYLSDSTHTPIIIDVCDSPSWTGIEQFFKAGNKMVLEARTISSNPDFIPPIDKIQQVVSEKDQPVLLTGLSAYLKLNGETVLRQQLRAMLDLSLKSKLVILTYKCAQYLSFDSDPRIASRRQIVLVDTVIETSKETRSLVFIYPRLKSCFDVYVEGISCIPLIEPTPTDNLHIVTSKHKENYPQSLYDIKEVNSAFDVIEDRYAGGIQTVQRQYGNNEQWEWLLNMLRTTSSWTKLISNYFGGTENLFSNADVMSGHDPLKQWLYFIALKLYGCQSNRYLSEVARLSESVAELRKQAYCHILDYRHTDKDFELLYKQRKDLLRKFYGESNSPELASFIKLAKGKEQWAINYLTDLTSTERKEIVSVICNYTAELSDDDLFATLSTVYPDLRSYLLPFHFSDAEAHFERYFNLYKMCKLRNVITPEIEDTVNEQAIKREYNSVYPHRAMLLSTLTPSRAKAYFMDALGVEFLSFIQQKCFEQGLMLSVKLGICNLPSITSENTEFKADFASESVPLADIKRLDDIKHNGQGDYNYENTKLPLHVVEELSEIAKIISDISILLKNGDYDRIYIVSDHGASRLAVIRESENMHEVAEKGIHSGRCCPTSELSTKPDCATEANGFWCLANYDRFKGGRKSNVEVHGGALLEEVVVPVITITKPDRLIDCKVETPEIIVSFKDKPTITIYCGVKSDNIAVMYGGKYYAATPTDVEYRYRVTIDAPMNAGDHTIDVYADDCIVGKGLSFNVKKRGGSERKFF